MRKIKIMLLLIIVSAQGFGTELLKIVSLAQSVSAMIQELGAGDQIVGCTSFCPVRDQENTQVVASAVDANIELIATLQPDLVFSTSLNKPQTIETLEKLGIKVVNLRYPKSYKEICDQFELIARTIGKEEKAKEVIATNNKKLATIIPSSHKPKVFLQIGSNPLFTVVPNTFMDDMIQYAGAENIAHDLTIGSITREKVVIENPDYIFIVSMGIVSEEETENWNQLKDIEAVKNNHIYQIDSNIACTPTPGNFLKSVEILLHFINQ